jgi:hypothetical protein
MPWDEVHPLPHELVYEPRILVVDGKAGCEADAVRFLRPFATIPLGDACIGVFLGAYNASRSRSYGIDLFDPFSQTRTAVTSLAVDSPDEHTFLVATE